MSAAAALARAEAAGVRLHLDAAGRVRLDAAAPPPREVVDGLRRHREEVAALVVQRQRAAAALLRFADEAAVTLAGREPDPIEDAERAAVFGGEATNARTGGGRGGTG